MGLDKYDLIFMKTHGIIFMAKLSFDYNFVT